MMIDDNTLLLYYGNELDETETARVRRALDDDAALAVRYRQLVADLERLQTLPVAAAPEIARARWHRTIDDAAEQERRKSRWSSQPLRLAAAAVLVLGVGVVIGLRLNPVASTDQTPMATVSPENDNGAPGGDAAAALNTDPPGSANAGPQFQQAAFSHGLLDYMQTSRDRLVTLAETEDAQRAAVLAEIIAHNRAFERVAESLGAEDVARVLRAFDPILQQLATQSGEPDALEQRIEQLSFEYGAMLTQMKARASKPYTL